MLNDKLTKNIILGLVVIIVITICGTVVIKTKQGVATKSEASDVGTDPDFDELALYGVDLSKEEEYSINKAEDLSEYEYGLSKNVSNGAILYAWCWSFDTIKDNLPNIAAAGYTSVQTSPVSECLEGENGSMDLNGEGKWYYQLYVTDYTVGNYQLGDREDLKNLCEEADKYGIKIVVDVIANQLCYKKDKISQNMIDAVGNVNSLFHIAGSTKINNINDRTELTYYRSGEGFDTNTENKELQDRLISFLGDCIALGVDGFRFSDAENIALPDDPVEEGSTAENNFWTRIIEGVKLIDKKIFMYGDISANCNNRIESYADTIGAVTAEMHAQTMRSWVNNENLEVDHVLDFNAEKLESNRLVTFVEDYHTYINETFNVFSEAQIKTSWAVITATGEGTPVFFSRPQGGGVKNNWWGSVNKIGEVGSDLYKDTDIVALNRFRNAMSGESTNVYNPEDSKNVIVIERGSKGCVIVNAGYEYKLDIESKLAEGLYLNKGENDTILDSKDGRLTGVIPAETIVVIYKDDVDNVNIPVVSISGYGMDSDFYTDELTITLQAVNAEKATFSLGGKSYLFEKGKTIRFGKNMAYGDTIEITLKAMSEDGVVTEQTFPFTKKQRDPNERVIYFERPEGWNRTIYVYFYSGIDGRKTFVKWPGVLMDDMGSGIYTYSITEKDDDMKVVFTDGVKQYPDVMKNGEDLEAGKTYKAQVILQ